ncbi:hypothetical protein K1719_043413 [Acacia pycnantha]|nr:hypothetical protein K1719_043413 [Acacia pycnantha]
MAHYDHHLISGHRLNFIIFSLLFLIVSSWTQQGFVTESRKTLKQKGSEQVVVSEDSTSVRARIGSRPPKCDGRCSWCGHCEAIQVPTNPQVQKEKKMNTSIAAYGRGDESTTSNYKPMSWKCKCGNLIFNP